MPDFNAAFPSKYLKASDLQGGQVIVTIERVAFEPVGHTREMKAVIYFLGKTKGLVCNKTNGKKIADVAGSPLTEDWAGVAIALYPTECEFGGETVDCIRVKAVQRVPSPARVLPAPLPVRPLPVAVNSGVDPITVDDIPF